MKPMSLKEFSWVHAGNMLPQLTLDSRLHILQYFIFDWNHATLLSNSEKSEATLKTLKSKVILYIFDEGIRVEFSWIINYN